MTVKIFGDIELLTVDDIANTLGVNVVTIRRYIRRGKLKAQKIGKNYFVSKENFKDFINGEGRKRGLTS